LYRLLEHLAVEVLAKGRDGGLANVDDAALGVGQGEWSHLPETRMELP
jgi:hypothetical protein